MKKTIFASGQNNHLQMLKSLVPHPKQKGSPHKTSFHLLYVGMVTIVLLFAPGSASGQCEDAIPCVSNITDYQCIVSGAVGALMGTKLLYYPGSAETTA